MFSGLIQFQIKAPDCKRSSVWSVLFANFPPQAFETAEKLGIPALLHPKELASSEVPDSLGVITYLFWYFCFFSETPGV